MSEMPERDTAPETAGRDGGKKERAGDNVTMVQELYQTLRSLAGIVLVIIVLFTFVVRVTVVDGESMENTFHHGDIVLTWALGYSPEQGDVVVLTQSSFRDESIIKRVIATGGQTVDVDYTTGTVYVDGEALDEPYIKEAMRVPYFGEGINHVTIPEGCVFVMGDNRNNSSDSRDPDIGIVDERCIIGQAVFVLFPFTAFGLV